MADVKQKATGAGIPGEEAVLKATGKAWAEWFALLDAAGCSEMNHKQIVAVLKPLGAGPWWQQMITVAYEQARGMRKQHETVDGYQVSASKTLDIPLERIWHLCTDPSARSAWTGDILLQERGRTELRKIRFDVPEKGGRAEMEVQDKGKGKTVLRIQHNLIPAEAVATEMKAVWKAALERIRHV